MNLKNIIISLVLLSAFIHIGDGFDDGVEEGAIANGLLFGIGGAMQLSMAFFLWKKKELGEIFWKLFSFVNGGFVVLLILVHFFRAPFAPTPKLDWEPLGFLILALEVTAVILACYHRRDKGLLRFINWIFIPTVAALAVYGLGMIGEQIFPSWILTEVL